MTSFLLRASYSPEGLKGVIANGGSQRRSAVSATLSQLGGHLQSFYFAFGADDVYVIADLPDNASAAALAMAIGGTGMAKVTTVVLLTPDEIDRAARLPIAYEPPGALLEPDPITTVPS